MKKVRTLFFSFAQWTPVNVIHFQEMGFFMPCLSFVNGDEIGSQFQGGVNRSVNPIKPRGGPNQPPLAVFCL